MVLRRPPLGHVLATAHDMGREHRIISALAGTTVPVAPALGYCDDIEVNGAPFYVMGFVDGVRRARSGHGGSAVLEPRLDATRASRSSTCSRRSTPSTSTPSGSATSAARRATSSASSSGGTRSATQSKTRELPAIDEVHDRLTRASPSRAPATIVHGDYRLDNCMVDDDGDVVAVLDWEICTLGDPLADVGLLMVYWSGPATMQQRCSRRRPRRSTASRPRRAARRATRERAAATCRSIDFYVAFGYWKLACIVEGVYARYSHGAMGADKDPSAFDHFRVQVRTLGRECCGALRGHRVIR